MVTIWFLGLAALEMHGGDYTQNNSVRIQAKQKEPFIVRTCSCVKIQSDAAIGKMLRSSANARQKQNRPQTADQAADRSWKEE